MRWYEAMFLGGLGGICPTLAKLGGVYSANHSAPPPEAGVFIALAIFAALGGIVALAFGRENLRAAIAAGIAAPAIVTNVLSGFQEIDQTTPQQSNQTAVITFFATPAFADTVPATVTYGSDIVTITPELIGGLPKSGTLPYQWMKDGQPIASASGDLPVRGDQVLRIPVGATGLEIDGRAVPLSAITNGDNAISLRIQTAPTIQGDLIWALGGARTYKIDDVQIAPRR
ncbi:hypothetical protein [Mameliella sp.]|uniref:hypothetical protein n=1 Tax=Mameliella sp. TaxID=1924940 RepID=UPI003BAD1DAD